MFGDHIYTNRLYLENQQANFITWCESCFCPIFSTDNL